MNIQFCLNNPNELWTQLEINDAKAAFEKAEMIERVMHLLVTRLIHSPSLHEKFPEVIPKFRSLYPVPKDPKDNTFCSTFQKVNEELLLLLTKEKEMSDESAWKINRALSCMNSLRSFTETMEARKFLHFTQLLFSSDQKIPDTLWTQIQKPDDPSKFISDVIASVEKKEINRSHLELSAYKTFFGTFEYFAARMSVGETIENPEIEQTIKWKTRYLQATEGNEKYAIASEILLFKEKERRHALPPSIVLDAFCFLAQKDNSLHLKSLAMNYIFQINQFNFDNITRFYN